jgi:hypothetical protein
MKRTPTDCMSTLLPSAGADLARPVGPDEAL